jgi:hypothetical protein
LIEIAEPGVNCGAVVVCDGGGLALALAVPVAGLVALTGPVAIVVGVPVPVPVPVADGGAVVVRDRPACVVAVCPAEVLAVG